MGTCAESGTRCDIDVEQECVAVCRRAEVYCIEKAVYVVLMTSTQAQIQHLLANGVTA